MSFFFQFCEFVVNVSCFIAVTFFYWVLLFVLTLIFTGIIYFVN